MTERAEALAWLISLENGRRCGMHEAKWLMLPNSSGGTSSRLQVDEHAIPATNHITVVLELGNALSTIGKLLSTLIRRS
jgi:hypothetical protein